MIIKFANLFTHALVGKSARTVFGSLIAALILSACPDNESTSSGSDTVIKEGIFIDSPVAGISYKTTPGNKSGVTDAQGHYNYVDGDTVTFSIGNIVFPSATAAEVVTPLSLAGTADLNNQQVVNISRLLQTLDSNPSDNVITIPQAAITAGENANSNLNFDVPTDTFETSVSSFVTEANGSPVMISINDAINSLQQNTLPTEFTTEWLSGKTLYGVSFGLGNDANGNEIDNVPVVAKLVFNNDGTVTYSGLLNGVQSTTINYGVTDTGGFYGVDSPSIVNIITCGSTAEYIATENLDHGVFDNIDLFFYDESAARNYADTLTESIPHPSCSSAPSEPSTPSASDYQLSGEYYFDGTELGMLVFYPNGFYIHWQGEPENSNCTDANHPLGGVEYGTYSYDGTTFTSTQLHDDNSDCGLTTWGSISMTVMSNGDLLVDDGASPFTLARMDSVADSIVGAWDIGGSMDSPSALVFFANGSYMQYQIPDNNDPNCTTGTGGTEYGTYSFDGTSLTATSIVDENGDCAGLTSEVNTATSSSGVSVTEDILSFGSPYTYDRL